MVKLGFIKDAEQSPPDFHRVFVRPAEGPLPKDGSVVTTVHSWPVKGGGQLFELAVDVPRGAENIKQWAPPMAKVISNMGWTQWWIDSFSLSMVIDRYITEALRLWGLAFWGSYSLESIVLVQVGLQREAVSQSIAAWHEKYSQVHFTSAHDYDAIEREQAQQVKSRTEKFKSFLKPKFISARRA